MSLGLLGTLLTSNGAITFGSIQFNLNTFFFSNGLVLVGSQTILTGVLARIFSSKQGFLPKTKTASFLDRLFTLERGLALGFFLVLFSVIVLGFLFIEWSGGGFSNLDFESRLRLSSILITLMLSGIQLVFSSFFASLIQV